MSNIFDLPNTLKQNSCYDYIGNVLLELNGKLDLPVNTAEIGVPCEQGYFGPSCENTRLAQTIEMIKYWNIIYDNGMKHDLVLTDNSDDKFFADNYEKLSEVMKYTNSYVFHNNRNHYQHIVSQGGEKSALLLPIKFSTGCWAFGMGYKAILHFEAKYTPDLDFDWKKCIDNFIKEDLWCLITGSRYGRFGWNHNIMIVKPFLWLLLSKVWKYHPERQNTDMMDCYEAFNQLGLVNSDDPMQPYKNIDKSKLKLWIDSPSEWYRKTKTVDYVETANGYEVLKL